MSAPPLSIIQSNVHGELRLDPSAAEESNLFAMVSSERGELSSTSHRVAHKATDIRGGVLLAYMPSLGQITHLAQVGSWEKEAVCEVRIHQYHNRICDNDLHCCALAFVLQAIALCTDACTQTCALLAEHLTRTALKKAGAGH